MPIPQDAYQKPIVPNKGAAGLKMGITPKAVQELWGDPLTIEQISADHVHWQYPGVGLWFKANKLDQIGLESSYEGKTKKNIGIGSTRSQVESAYGWLSWDGTWLINNPPFGIGFDFNSSIVGEPRVTAIYVFRE